ncbi:unnamed protein product [Amaranthus hypochondriacus]
MSTYYCKFLLIVSLVTIITSTYSSSIRDKGNGDYQPIKNLNDPYVQEIAKYAIDEHDKEKKDHLGLVKLVKGEFQVVSGINYRLIISANDTLDYEAIVFDNKRLHQRRLTSFIPVF